MVVAAGPLDHANKPRVLVVEDNYLVANSLIQSLNSIGCEVIGPAPTLDKGLKLAQEENLHGGILDINIIGGTSASIAIKLHERDIPFFFITGYASPQMLPKSLANTLKLRKPIDERALASMIEDQFGSS